jgi:hypothetical protein
MSSNNGSELEEQLDVVSHMGGSTLPWQFSVTRTADTIVVTQARGPKERFDPVVKEFDIVQRPLEDGPQSFKHTVSRRVWSEDSARPEVRSQRSEGQIVEFLLHDDEGWHLDRPEPETALDTEPPYYDTAYSGIILSDASIRTRTDDDLKYTEEREYRLAPQFSSAYDTVYVLWYHELNEESDRAVRWEIANANAYQLR